MEIRPNRSTGRGIEPRPPYVYDPSFDTADAVCRYDADELPESGEANYMVEELTREAAKRMHYASHRMQCAASDQGYKYWTERYLWWRDKIIVGNIKLIYRVVGRHLGRQHHWDDAIGECQIVLVKAVAFFNPWKDVRFSTYAYTCLKRAAYRIASKGLRDRWADRVDIDRLSEPVSQPEDEETRPSTVHSRVAQYFQDDDQLLNIREKAILTARFFGEEGGRPSTLEKVALTLGISKERVRQVQQAALGKLRSALELQVTTC